MTTHVSPLEGSEEILARFLLFEMDAIPSQPSSIDVEVVFQVLNP